MDSNPGSEFGAHLPAAGREFGVSKTKSPNYGLIMPNYLNCKWASIRKLFTS